MTAPQEAIVTFRTNSLFFYVGVCVKGIVRLYINHNF